jgi:hypothetical protein
VNHLRKVTGISFSAFRIDRLVLILVVCRALSPPWALSARSDLVLIYKALGEHEKEQKVRKELAALQR